jgi:hypothetical protein
MADPKKITWILGAGFSKSLGMIQRVGGVNAEVSPVLMWAEDFLDTFKRHRL